MKIEIINSDPSGVHGYEIIDTENGGPQGRHIQNNKSMFTRFFDEEEILTLLGENGFKLFESGKYDFNVTKKQIFAISDDLNYYSL